MWDVLLLLLAPSEQGHVAPSLSCLVLCTSKTQHVSAQLMLSDMLTLLRYPRFSVF